MGHYNFWIIHVYISLGSLVQQKWDSVGNKRKKYKGGGSHLSCCSYFSTCWTQDGTLTVLYTTCHLHLLALSLFCIPKLECIALYYAWQILAWCWLKAACISAFWIPLSVDWRLRGWHAVCSSKMWFVWFWLSMLFKSSWSQSIQFMVQVLPQSEVR